MPAEEVLEFVDVLIGAVVRPDQHVAWRGQRISDTSAANAIISMMLGW